MRGAACQGFSALCPIGSGEVPFRMSDQTHRETILAEVGLLNVSRVMLSGSGPPRTPVSSASIAATDGATRPSACRRCHRPAPPWNSPLSLAWEPIIEDGEVVGVICPDCLTLREQRAIQAEKARVFRRLKRGLPSS